jgi:hypothetical protein
MDEEPEGQEIVNKINKIMVENQLKKKLNHN